MTAPKGTGFIAFADGLGIGILALQLFAALILFFPNDESRFALGAVSFLVLAGGALYMWHGTRKGVPISHKISSPSEWAKAILVTVVAGAVSFACDMLVGHFDHPGISLFKAGTKAGSPFGFVATLFLCPGCTMIAIAGFFRSLLLDESLHSKS